MKRHELEHLIRAASAVTNEYELVIIGSQSILGEFPSAPGPLLHSMEADMWPLNDPTLSDLIDGSIGEGSPFHDRFKYYAQGVGPETAILPKGWNDRLVKVQNQNTDNKIGYCLEIHDLAASKLAAFREKDRDFLIGLVKYEMIKEAIVIQRINALPENKISQDRKKMLIVWISDKFSTY